MFTKFPLHVGIIVALYDYNSTDPDELSFKKSERLQIVDASDLNRWKTHSLVTGKEGYMPRNYVAPVQSIQEQEYVTYVTCL